MDESDAAAANAAASAAAKLKVPLSLFILGLSLVDDAASPFFCFLHFVERTPLSVERLD